MHSLINYYAFINFILILSDSGRHARVTGDLRRVHLNRICSPLPESPPMLRYFGSPEGQGYGMTVSKMGLEVPSNI